jgi:hypothetical protein
MGKQQRKGAYRSHDIRSPTSSPFFVELHPRWSGLGTIPVKGEGIGVGGGATFIVSFVLKGGGNLHSTKKGWYGGYNTW